MSSYDPIREEVAANVARGAGFLDTTYPDWYRFDFDWENLDLGNAEKCIIGQLSRSAAPWVGYADGLALVSPNGQATQYGYCHGSIRGMTYAEATQFYDTCWKAEVEKRLNAITFPPEGHTVTLNATERALLLELLDNRAQELAAEQELLKPQYREFLNPPLMTARALYAAVHAAV